MVFIIADGVSGRQTQKNINGGILQNHADIGTDGETNERKTHYL